MSCLFQGTDTRVYKYQNQELRGITYKGKCVFRATRILKIQFEDPALSEYQDYINVEVFRQSSLLADAPLGKINTYEFNCTNTGYWYKYNVYDGDILTVIISNSYTSAVGSIILEFPSSFIGNEWYGFVGDKDITLRIDSYIQVMELLPVTYTCRSQEDSVFMDLLVYNPNPFPVRVTLDDFYVQTSTKDPEAGHAWGYSTVIEANSDSGDWFYDGELLVDGYLEIHCESVDFPEELGVVNTYYVSSSFGEQGDVRTWMMQQCYFSDCAYGWPDDGNNFMDVTIGVHNSNSFNVDVCFLSADGLTRIVTIPAYTRYTYTSDISENDDGQWAILWCQPSGLSYFRSYDAKYIYVDEMSESSGVDVR